MKKLFSLFLVLLLIVSICGCSAKEDITDNTTENNTSEQISSTEGENLTNSDDLLAEFIPFECSGDYYSFNNEGHVKSETGIDFFVKYSDDLHTICYTLNSSTKELYSVRGKIILYAYIDNAIYFSADYNTTLYRIELYYDETGEIHDSTLSLVSERYTEPVKAEKNRMLLALGLSGACIDGDYAWLDTKTGVLTDTKFNYTADYNSYSDVAQIDESKALDIAKEELLNKKYWFEFTNTQPEFEVDHEPLFVINPHFTFGWNADWVYDAYPEYVWDFTFKAVAVDINVVVNAGVAVNAVSGEVSYVYTIFND
ncbi:MAG: hypothetical protein J1E36_08270 [Eubacterium sp.]|nr:hypothetical protein [Eubacterium sp.]